jgi:hypothetical protein
MMFFPFFRSGLHLASAAKYHSVSQNTVGINLGVLLRAENSRAFNRTMFPI